MKVKNKNNRDIILRFISKKLIKEEKILKEDKLVYYIKNKNTLYNPVRQETNLYVILKNIKHNLSESNSLYIGFRKFDKLPEYLQDKLRSAPKFEKTKNSYLIDFEPEVEGCIDYFTHNEMKLNKMDQLEH